MKSVSYLFVLFLVSRTTLSHAQTVYAGEATVDKVKLSGLYLTLQGDGRQIEKDWEEQLKTYGRLSTSRGTFRVSNADISSVSPEPINLVSTVKSSKSAATIFTSFDLGSGNFVKPGDAGYNAAESLLKTFSATTQHNQEVRLAEGSFDEAQKAHQKAVRTGERLQRDIENNAKEKEKLLKRIDENAKELEKLQQDIETNKTEQATALTELENRKNNVEAVKKKKP